MIRLPVLFALATFALSLPNQAVVFGSDTPSAGAAILALSFFNVTKITYTSDESIAFTSMPLNSSSGTANFSMIILGSGQLGTNFSPKLFFRELNNIKGFSPAQWSQIYSYQRTNNVRLIALYDVPGTGLSVSYSNSSTVASDIIKLSSASTIATIQAGLNTSYSVNFNSGGLGQIYPANILNTSAVTPVLNFIDSTTGQSTAAAVVYRFSETQQQMSFFYQTAAWDVSNSNSPSSVVKSVSSLTNAIWISWASDGYYCLKNYTDQTAHAGSVTPFASAAISVLPTFADFYIAYTTATSIRFMTLSLLQFKV
ncbi:hypothetical protein HK100_001189 [Physocladia obscura]|uniref:Agd3 CBM87 domain-containing protein n=1 Tax=Physocladia obscura TaxID=109957 RepID=A0AAD5SY95_9FUNG|nr:hypothetical protein HK100_001189 [Physocladia obscura]